MSYQDVSDLEFLPLPDTCDTEYVATVFDRHWNEEISTAQHNAAEYNASIKAASIGSKREKILKGHRQPSLARCLLKAYGRDFVKAGVLKLFRKWSFYSTSQLENFTYDEHLLARYS